MNNDQTDFAATADEIQLWHANKGVQSMREDIADQDDDDERRHQTLARSATMPLPDLWFEISERCKVTPKQAANFVDRGRGRRPDIYGANRSGLFALLVGSECAVDPWVESYNAAGVMRWDRAWCTENLGFLVLSTADARRILSAAIQAYCVESPPLSGESAAAPGYLDPSHPRYAPKLAAAVHAWLAADDSAGKTPKQALSKWLHDHASEFGLVKETGEPNEQGIEECAKVANWRTDGGAPKTPGA